MATETVCRKEKNVMGRKKYALDFTYQMKNISLANFVPVHKFLHSFCELFLLSIRVSYVMFSEASCYVTISLVVNDVREPD